MAKKLDRRQKYTRLVLKESLLKLLEHQPISTVTVKQICQHADINRSTFYAHYKDQFDLLKKIEEEIIEDLYAYLDHYGANLEKESIQMVEKLLDYIGDNQQTFHILLNQNAAPAFEKRLQDIAQHFMIQHWMKEQPVDEQMSMYLSTFAVSGAIHVIKKWIARDMDLSHKRLSKMINQFINYGLSYLNEHKA